MPNWGAAGQGAASGAAVGTAIAPGWGTAIGAAAGGLYGLLGGGGGPATLANTPDWMLTQPLLDQKKQQAAAAAANGDQIKSTLMNLATNTQARQAPQIGGSQFTVDPTGRQGLIDTTGRLGAIAAGTQQGAGEMAVNAQLGRANAAQIAAARASRGANAALAYRNAMRNTADLGLAGAGQAGAARLQDQAAANQQLGGMFANLYGQDAGVAAQNAQLAQAAQIANQQASIQSRAQNDAMQIQALGQLLGWDQQTINAHLAAIQQQRANAEQPNVLANLGQAAGTYMQLKGMGAFGGNAGPGSAPAAGGSLASQFPHGGDSGPVTSPDQV